MYGQDFDCPARKSARYYTPAPPEARQGPCRPARQRRSGGAGGCRGRPRTGNVAGCRGAGRRHPYDTDPRTSAQGRKGQSAAFGEGRPACQNDVRRSARQRRARAREEIGGLARGIRSLATEWTPEEISRPRAFGLHWPARTAQGGKATGRGGAFPQSGKPPVTGSGERGSSRIGKDCCYWLSLTRQAYPAMHPF